MNLNRRQLLLGGLGVGTAELSGCAGPTNRKRIAGTLAWVTNAYADASSVRLACKTAGAFTARFQCKPSDGGETAYADFSPDADGYSTLVVSGLSADTTFDWEILVDGVSAETGSIKTMPPAGSAVSFNFGWGSCFDKNTSDVFALLSARAPLFFSMLGDWGYQYISEGANGKTSPTDPATVRTDREAMLAAVAPGGFFTNRSIAYTYSDCDGAGVNSDGVTGGHATGAVQAAYRQQFAHPMLPVSGCGARSWVIGRLRFIQTDETSLASAKSSTDNSSKTKLGVTQKAWFMTEVAAAAAAGEMIVWLGDGSWIEPTGTGASNSWARYSTERTEVGAYIAASGAKLVRLHGDTHTLFYDDGTNNPWGRFASASAAPMHTTAQMFGQTTSGGKWPTVTTNSSRQYGIGEVADDGSVITLTLRGYSSTDSAPTEVERFKGVVSL